KKDVIRNPEIEVDFVVFTNWSTKKARPIVINNSKKLEVIFDSKEVYKGLTATAGGFYGPQGRVLRLPLQDPDLNRKMDTFNFNGMRITNFEMQTSVIYGLSKLLGHHALSLNAIIANRATGQFCKDLKAVVEKLISYSLNKLL